MPRTTLNATSVQDFQKEKDRPAANFLIPVTETDLIARR
jgi:hypothetical protein